MKEEFKALPKKFHNDLIISKSVNSLAVEINYENTWKNGQMGIPIFSIEDMYAGTHMFQAGMMQMGIIPTIAYDANIFISLGLGTLDAEGQLARKGNAADSESNGRPDEHRVQARGWFENR